ncbi:hypothetical protein GTQ34_03895 [Muricauda sp. JGD-17]|uniref:WD40 repeat protein n=1 Tax=Flagellimonas ochracea TaxID=2696472 RepID=A0A964TBM9_9FLAO|nr:PD40 domain-containing protein [Allomuricauda ochracea]NAY91053.1 hypothetical protein [Allomuricauda ochracea]
MKTKILIVFFISVFFVSGQETLSVAAAFPQFIEFDKVRDFTMNQLGTEAYFSIQSQTEEISVITVVHKEAASWSQPKIVPFSGTYRDFEPFLSPDGLRLYFVSNRPLHDSISEPKDFDIWYVERSEKSKEWSKPINLGSPVNTEHNEFYPSLAENGNLYFTSDSPQAIGQDDIFFSEYIDGKYSQPITLSKSINSEGFEYNAYISKNESYLIFGGYNREDGKGSGDLYISFKVNDKWAKAKPLPIPINSKYMDYCPFMDEENHILYFTSRRSKNPESPMTHLGALKEFLNSYQNGNSRLYKAKINLSILK